MNELTRAGLLDGVDERLDMTIGVVAQHETAERGDARAPAKVLRPGIVAERVRVQRDLSPAAEVVLLDHERDAAERRGLAEGGPGRLKATRHQYPRL